LPVDLRRPFLHTFEVILALIGLVVVFAISSWTRGGATHDH
jgi:hypothetical protein